MAYVTCDVHYLLEDDLNKRVVRIRADAFKDKRCIVRIENAQCSTKFACFGALYADDPYIGRWQKKYPESTKSWLDPDTNLVFMCETWRILLDGDDGSSLKSVKIKEIQGTELHELYAVHSSLSEDSNEGRIFILNKNLRSQLKGKREIVRIKRKDKKDAKSVYGEALYADGFYLEDWQEIWKKKGFVREDCNLVFISEWHRLLLGTNIGEIIDLKIDPLKGLWKLLALLYLYPRDHPQAVVRIASLLGFIGLGLGVIGVGLGVIGIKDWLAKIPTTGFQAFLDGWILFGLAALVIGAVITLLGLIGFVLRR